MAKIKAMKQIIIKEQFTCRKLLKLANNTITYYYNLNSMLNS